MTPSLSCPKRQFDHTIAGVVNAPGLTGSTWPDLGIGLGGAGMALLCAWPSLRGGRLENARLPSAGRIRAAGVEPEG